MLDVCIETARLKLVPSTMQWREELFALFHEPEVADWLFLTGPPTLEQLTRRIDIHEAFWREFGYGMFAVIEKDSGRFVGRVGSHGADSTLVGSAHVVGHHVDDCFVDCLARFH